MASHHLHDELDSSNPGSVSSSPRFVCHHSWQQPTTHDLHAQVRLICSFGGKIVPRSHDNRLCYVGGDTRIITVHRTTTFTTLQAKLSKLSGILSGNMKIKYQLPYEDLDALISVSNDEDVENMIEEYDRFAQDQNPGQRVVRFRLFLFNTREENRPTNFGSIPYGPADQEKWFLDAPSESEPAYATQLKPGRSKASSFASQLPNSKTGVDKNDRIQLSGPKWKTLSKLSDSGHRTPDPTTAAYISLDQSYPPVKNRPEISSVSTRPSGKDESSNFMEMGCHQVSNLGGHAPNSHHFESTGQPEQVYSIIDPMEANNARIVASVPIQVPYLIPYSSSSGQIPLVEYRPPVSVIGYAYNQITRSIQEMDPSNEPIDGLNRGQHFYY